MDYSISILKADPTNSNAMIASTGLVVTLRIYPYSSTTYTATEVSDGNYKFTNISDGDYKLYIDAVENTDKGIFHLSDMTPHHDTITEYTAATGVTVDGVLIKDSLDASGIVAKTGAQTVAGVKTFSSPPKSSSAASATTELIRWDEASRLADNQIVAGTRRYDAAVLFNGNCPTTTEQPGTTASLTRKDYVDAAVQSASGNFIESVNLVSVQPEISPDQPDVAYADIGDAIASFSSPAAANECCVLIKGMGASAEHIILTHADLVDNVAVRGIGKHIKLNLGASELTANNNMRFENLSIFMGNGITLAARTCSNIQFDNCDIYYYNDITFNGDNAQLTNCNLYGASGKDVTYDDAIEILNCRFMQNTIKGGSFDGFADFIDNINNSYSMPADPTVA